MHAQRFRAMLKSRKLAAKKIAAAVALAQRFETFIESTGGKPDAETTWYFCKVLIAEGGNTYDNLLALARYGQFIQNDAVYVAVLELLDGREAQANLYQRVGELFGEDVRDEVFAGIGVAPLGTPSTEKPGYMFPVLERLTKKVGRKAVEQLLSACLRDLSNGYYRNQRRRYLRARNIDEYLAAEHRYFVRTLKKCQQAGELFFAQEITDQVLEFVRKDPEMGGGVRVGHIVYDTKIPYNAKQFLAEEEPLLKRYHACHCPWAREAIRTGAVAVDPIFCNCSAGFTKKPWEVIFGQTLRVEVLESVLRGDMRCRFAIHLPENLEPG